MEVSILRIGLCSISPRPSYSNLHSVSLWNSPQYKCDGWRYRGLLSVIGTLLVCSTRDPCSGPSPSLQWWCRWLSCDPSVQVLSQLLQQWSLLDVPLLAGRGHWEAGLNRLVELDCFTPPLSLLCDVVVSNCIHLAWVHQAWHATYNGLISVHPLWMTRYLDPLRTAWEQSNLPWTL